MIEFDGYITGKAEEHYFKVSKASARKVWFFIFILPFPGILSHAIYFGFWMLFKIYCLSCVIWFCSMFFLPTKKDLRAFIPKRVYIQDEHITVINDKQGQVNKLEDVKKVIDYGEFYELTFPFGKSDKKFICQKSLLTKGALEEFESLFEDKIERKTM